MRGPRRSTKHHKSEMLLRSSLHRSLYIKPKLSLYATNCEICGYEPSKYVCPLCGRYVCETHYYKKNNMCIACAEALCDVCRNSLAVGRCINCGRKICHSCSIELDEIHRLCYFCLISKSI